MSERDKRPGIYKIISPDTDKVYVGKAEDIDNWKKYIPFVNLYKYDSPELYEDMKKMGWSWFFFEPLESCPIEKLDERRNYWIKKLQTDKYGYNKTTANTGKIDIRVNGNLNDEYLKDLGYKPMWYDSDIAPYYGFNGRFYKYVDVKDYDKEIELLEKKKQEYFENQNDNIKTKQVFLNDTGCDKSYKIKTVIKKGFIF